MGRYSDNWQCPRCGRYHPDGRTKEARECKESARLSELARQRRVAANLAETTRLRTLDHERAIKQVDRACSGE